MGGPEKGGMQQVMCKVVEARGARLAIDKTAKSMYVVTVGMEVMSTDEEGSPVDRSKEVKTGPRQKNHVTEGANFGSTVAGEKGGALAAFVKPARGLKVKFALYERLRTDLVETYTLGAAHTKEVAMSEDSAEPQVLTLDSNGGELVVKVWTTKPAKELFSKYEFIFTRKTAFVASVSLCIGLALVFSLKVAFFLMAPFFGVWFVLDLPVLIALFLTSVLALAVPGLGLSLSAARLGASLDRAGKLRVRVGVDDFKLANDPKAGFYYKDFVSVKNLRLQIKLDLVETVRNLYALLLRKQKPTVEKVLTVKGVDLAAKDHYLTEKSSSDPYFKLFVAPKGAVPSNGADIDTKSVDPDSFVMIARSEFIPKNLNPEWEPLMLDLDDILQSEDPDSFDVVVWCYDFDYASASDLIGAARVSSLREFLDEKWKDRSVTLYKKGHPAGDLLFTVSTQTQSQTAFWSPFPTVNEAIRAQRKHLPAPRLVTVGLDLQVNDPTVAFDISEECDEFNVNNFNRRLAASKLKQPVPNLLKVDVTSATARVAKITVELRGKKEVFQKPFDGTQNNRAVFNCNDPSAVVVVRAVDAKKRKLGVWITTLKMLKLAPENSHSTDVKTLRDGSVELTAQMRANSCAVPTEAYVGLKLKWVYDETAPSYKENIKASKLKALEQLQQNSAETTLKLGNLKLLGHMLEDFPVLFDIQAMEINRVRFFLKALFAGYETSTERDKPIFVESIDLRDKLKSDDGVDLAELSFNFVKAAVGPVLANVSVSQAAGHILSGVYTGVFSKSSSSLSAAPPPDQEHDPPQQVSPFFD